MTPAGRRAALFAAALSLTAACGSTVVTGAGSTGQEPTAEEGTTADQIGGPEQVAPGTSPTAAGGTGGGVAGSAGPSVSGQRPGGVGTGPGAAGAAVGPGITADRIFLGIAYFPDAAATNASLGAAGADSGDQRDYYNAVIEELNQRGGILGRKVAPLYFEYRTSSGEPVDSQHQRACDFWTKDNKVFAILFRGRVLQECARKAGALITVGDGEAGPAYDRLPNLVDPAAIRLERLGQTTVSGLARQSYFKPTTDWPTGKVGIITWDDIPFRYGVSHGYVPALKRLGITAPVRYVPVSQNADGFAGSGAAVSSAVLAFNDAGIDHVLIQDGPAGLFGLGGLTLLFLNNARSQQYYPRYGFNANNVPGFAFYPADQQRGMLAVDFSDYMPSQDDGIRPNTARTRCFAIMRKRGVIPSDQSTYLAAAAACEQVWFIEVLLRRAQQPTLQGALTAATQLGTSFQSTTVYGTRLGPGRRDGAELARNARYDESCSCMRFTSAPYAP